MLSAPTRWPFSVCAFLALPPECFSEYLLRSYGGVEDIFSDNSPGVGIGPLRSGCGEKTVCNQNFGCADCFPSIPEGAVVAELADGDGVSAPARQPRQESLCGRFGRLFDFGWWPFSI
jgi:hypothetical protein